MQVFLERVDACPVLRLEDAIRWTSTPYKEQSFPEIDNSGLDSHLDVGSGFREHS